MKAFRVFIVLIVPEKKCWGKRHFASVYVCLMPPDYKYQMDCPYNSPGLEILKILKTNKIKCSN